MSAGAAPPPAIAQEPEQDLDAIANELFTQHYGPQSLTTRCSWCGEIRQLQTIQRHTQLGDGWGELHLCGRCTVLWQLWEVIAFAPQGLEEYAIQSVRDFRTFWRGLIRAFRAVVHA